MNASDALRLLSQHPSIGGAITGGLLSSGSALAYNAFSQPTLDEYGNVIESNDINPIAAGLGGAVIGAIGGDVYGRMNQPVARPVQGMSAGASPQPRQSPDININAVSPNIKGWDYVEPENIMPVYQPRNREELEAGINWIKMNQDNYNQYKAVEDLREASTPIRRIIPANPMQPQPPMSPPGMKTVVMQQPTKTAAQQMMEESLNLQELARQQQAQKLEADAVIRYQRQQGARRDMHIGGWNNSKGNYNTQYPEDNDYNIAGWDVINPSRQQQERLEYEAMMAQKKIA